MGGGETLLAAGQKSCLLLLFFMRLKLKLPALQPQVMSGWRMCDGRVGWLAGCQLPPSSTCCLMSSFCCVFGLMPFVWLMVARRDTLFQKTTGQKCECEPSERPGCRLCLHCTSSWETEMIHLGCHSKKHWSVYLTLGVLQ